MPLSPGTRLGANGAYEIVSLLGAGGMGEVYRARDHGLMRDVALKVLPEVAAGDADRRERFTREALAVAALNHPHIVTIHAVENEASSVFLIMELVEGRSLAETLPPAGLPLERVLAIGIAVAEAISAAHQKGITHRDLKPANIMIGEGEQAGRIKVLDFGLAKMTGQEPGPEASALPTAAPPHAPMTAEGHILGTTAYMSPEQAEGRTIDGRSDLFSLGVVLYETATGQRPFTGETHLSTLSSILRDTPRPVTDLNPALPRDLERIIRRALAKDPERRYQTAKDLRNDLEDLKASLDSGDLTLPSANEVASPAPAVRSTPPAEPLPSSDAQLAVALARRHTRGVAAAAAVLVIGMAIALYLLLPRDAQPVSSEEVATVPSLADLQVTPLTTSGNAERPSISSDGRYVAYVQRDENDYSLWLRQTTTTSNVQIVAAEPGVTLFGATFTPDSTAVDFIRQPQGGSADVWRVPFLGGAPRQIIGNVASSIAWAPDGQHMAFLRSRISPSLSSQLIVAGPDGGQERVLISVGLPAIIVSLMAPWRPNLPPAWSPDGRLIAVATAEIGPSSSGGTILFVDGRSGAIEQKAAVPTGVTVGLSWLDARSLVVNQPLQTGAPNQLFRLPYPAGPLSRLTNDPNSYVGVSLTSDRRSLVTAQRDARMDVWVGDGTGAIGSELVKRAPTGVVERIAWSGDRLLYGTILGGKPTIARLTPGETTPEGVVSDGVTPAATTDGRTILFVSTATDDSLSLWSADAGGRRVTRLATQVTASHLAVTPDDRFVLFNSLATGTVSIWMVPIEGGIATKLADGSSPAIAPDGRSLVFTAPAESNRSSLVVCALPDCTSPRTVGSAALEAPIGWVPGGRGVAYAVGGNLWVQALDGSAPRQLTRFADSRPIRHFAWSRDGTRLAIARGTVTTDIVLFTGVQ